jgi:hypothetical protein
MNTTFHSSNMNSESDFYAIKLPEYRRAKLELWKFINLNDFDALLRCFDCNTTITSGTDSNLNNNGIQNSINKTNSFVRSTVNRPNNDEYYKFKMLVVHQLHLNIQDKKDQILIDKYYYLIKYALANSFNKEQINCLLALFKRTHDMAVETSFGNLDETYDYFKNLLLNYAVHRPPYSLCIFSIKQADSIVNYMFDTYFNQFKFYKYVFSLAVRLNLKFKYSNLPAPTDSIHDQLVDTSQINSKDFMGDMSISNQHSNEIKSETSGNDQDELVELKEFIRNYLGDKLNKMKQELNDEMSLGSSRKTPNTDRTGKKSESKLRK